MTFELALSIASLAFGAFALFCLAMSIHKNRLAEAAWANASEARAMEESELEAVDLRAVGYMTEAAALVGGQTWVREMRRRGAALPDVVTVLYRDAAGDDCTTEVGRDEPGVVNAGRR